MGILVESAFKIRSKANRLKGYTTGQLVCWRDMIIPIKHNVDWELTPQRNQAKINKYNIRENIKIVD